MNVPLNSEVIKAVAPEFNFKFNERDPKDVQYRGTVL